MNYKEMTIEDMIQWCEANNQLDWLEKAASKETVNEDGKKRKASLKEIKKEFATKFMPEILPTPKKLSILQKIQAAKRAANK